MNLKKSKWHQSWIAIDIRALTAMWKSVPHIEFFTHVTKVAINRCWRFLRFLMTRRRIELLSDEVRMSNFVQRKDKSTPRLFNLDLHIGVVADLEQTFKHIGISLTRWSISGHNHLVEGRLPVSDPVRYINQRSWRTLNLDLIEKFQVRYGKFLQRFDGFVCTYSPTFAEIFRDLGKPVLVVAATRYEAPYTDRPADWERFNKYLVDGVHRNQIVISANNLGDADYLKYFTGLNVPVVPSLCSKPDWDHRKTGPRVVMCHDQKLIELVETQTAHAYNRVGILGSPYSWSSLAQCQEVLIFPQNISTMTLFELATAGVSVAVPSRRWIRELRDNGFGVLDECTLYESYKLPCDELSTENPINYQSSEYLDWWLDRADFYDTDLMPNIRIVDSMDELLANLNRNTSLDDLRIATNIRNSRITSMRHDFITGFSDLL